MRRMMIASMVALAGMAAASAASGQTGVPGTVNAAGESEIARARAAIVHAGYQPVVLEFAQDHNLFFTATKGGETYGITVTPDGKVYVSTGIQTDRRS